MKKGFTILELLIMIGIVGILFSSGVVAFHNFKLQSDVENSTEEIANALRLAQNKTISSEAGSTWGVYFNTSALPHQYIIFKGENYASRDVSADIVRKISGTVLISEISLGSGSEAVFNKVTGASRQSGSVKLTSQADASQFKTVYIASSGQVDFTPSATLSDLNRLKDSRHINLDYSRYIATSTENLVLTFFYDTSTQIEIIPIASNLIAGQIKWEGQIDVAGSLQTIKIHTKMLNDPLLGSQFSIHRDRRFNNKALKIELSGDSSGTLAEYAADGLSVTKTSIYVTNLQWQ